MGLTLSRVPFFSSRKIKGWAPRFRALGSTSWRPPVTQDSGARASFLGCKGGPGRDTRTALGFSLVLAAGGLTSNPKCPRRDGRDAVLGTVLRQHEQAGTVVGQVTADADSLRERCAAPISPALSSIMAKKTTVALFPCFLFREHGESAFSYFSLLPDYRISFRAFNSVYTMGACDLADFISQRYLRVFRGPRRL